MNTLNYVKAERGRDGRYRLFYRGTRNEVYPGSTWPTAAAARTHARVELARNCTPERGNATAKNNFTLLLDDCR